MCVLQFQQNQQHRLLQRRKQLVKHGDDCEIQADDKEIDIKQRRHHGIVLNGRSLLGTSQNMFKRQILCD